MAKYPAGTYELQIAGTVGSGSDSFILSVELVDPCSSAKITLQDSVIENATYTLRGA